MEELPLGLAIIDETIVMFGMEDPVAGSTQLTMVVVEHRALAHLLLPSKRCGSRRSRSINSTVSWKARVVPLA